MLYRSRRHRTCTTSQPVRRHTSASGFTRQFFLLFLLLLPLFCGWFEHSVHVRRSIQKHTVGTVDTDSAGLCGSDRHVSPSVAVLYVRVVGVVFAPPRYFSVPRLSIRGSVVLVSSLGKHPCKREHFVTKNRLKPGEEWQKTVSKRKGPSCVILGAVSLADLDIKRVARGVDQ